MRNGSIFLIARWHVQSEMRTRAQQTLRKCWELLPRGCPDLQLFTAPGQLVSEQGGAVPQVNVTADIWDGTSPRISPIASNSSLSPFSRRQLCCCAQKAIVRRRIGCTVIMEWHSLPSKADWSWAPFGLDTAAFRLLVPAAVRLC